MDVQPATFFGFTFDTWFWLVITVLGVYAMVVQARRKRQAFSALGDEPHEEAESAAGAVEPGRSGDSPSKERVSNRS